MPSKTIYVSEDDLELFERAKAISGDNLSAAIAEALAIYLERYETKERGFEKITLKVGKVAYAMKRFEGRLLAKAVTTAEYRHPVEVFEVYETPKGNYVAYRAIPPTAGGLSGSEANWPMGQIEYRLDVCQKISELYGYVPAELVAVVERIASGQEIEALDI